MLITFEGIDGSGKTTCATALQTFLSQKCGRSVVRLREPGGTPLGEKIRNILTDELSDISDPTTEFLLFSAARKKNKEQIESYLNQGYIVIMDRYFDSSVAYQGAKKVPAVLISTVNQHVIVKPSLTIYLQITPEAAMKRWSHYDEWENKFSLEYMKEVSSIYDLICNPLLDKRFKIINADQEFPKVMQSICSYLVSLTGGKEWSL